MKSWDFDGCVSEGMVPDKGDVIITGRGIDEADVVYKYLKKNKIKGIPVFFNPITKQLRGDHTEKGRRISGYHKALTINNLGRNGVLVLSHIDDDPIQADIIRDNVPDLEVILVESGVEL